MFQAACGGLAEGVGLVASGDLSPARTAFFIPPGCFKPPAADWRKGWDWSPPATCLRLELRSSSHRDVSSRLRRIGGRGGIRTHGGFNPTLDFESSALNRTQPPFLINPTYTRAIPSEISNFKFEIPRPAPSPPPTQVSNSSLRPFLSSPPSFYHVPQNVR
jgi:hypothetical protein